MSKLTKRTLSRVAKRILPYLALSTVMSLTIYGAVHLSVRQGANEQQIQISESLVKQIEGGLDPSTLFTGTGETDIKTDLSPFAIAYDENGEVVGSSAQLNGQAPKPPRGVFDYAKSKGQNRRTLEPAPGVRVAAVIQHYKFADKDGYLLVGRSLREVEKTLATTGKLVGLGWLASNAAVVGAFYLPLFIQRQQKNKQSKAKK